MKIVCGSASKHLADVFDASSVVNLKNKNFSDGEVYIELDEKIDSRIAAIVQSTNSNDALCELFLTVSLLKDLCIEKVIAVIPYFGYARQDRRVHPYSPISIKVMIRILESLGVDYVITVDLHSDSAKDFFDIPVLNLSPTEVFSLHHKRFHDLNNTLVVAPDFGAEKRNADFANELGVRLSIINKHRSAPGISEVIEIIGESDIRDKNIVIVDDIVDSGGTLCNAAKFLKDVGAASVVVYITHGVFSGNGINMINTSCIDHLYITDSIVNPRIKESKIKTISIASLIKQYLSKIATSL